jgi:hypothetical protein
VAIVLFLFCASVDSVAEAQTSGWSIAKIGSLAKSSAVVPACVSSAGPACGTFSITSTGRDIGGTADEFTFVSQSLDGDGVIIAKVAITGSSGAKAGLMIRESNAAGARSAFVYLSADTSIGFDRRQVGNFITAHTAGPRGGATAWLKLERRSSAILTASTSSDGVNWTPIASDALLFPSRVSIGLAVTGHDASTAATGTFSSVSRGGDLPAGPAAADPPTAPLTEAPPVVAPPDVAPPDAPTGETSSDAPAPSALPDAPAAAAPPPEAPVEGALPAGWSSQTIGPLRAGAAAYLGSTFTVIAAGTDIWDPADEFRFVYRRVSGDVDVIARVSSLTGAQAWTKAGVMIRESLTPTAAHASLFVSTGKGVAYQRRVGPGLPSSSTAGPLTKAPGWVKLERRGSTITALWSKDSTSWTVIGSDVVTLPSSFYVGLAVTSHSATATAVAAFDHVTVSTPVKTVNLLPAVSLTAPVPNALVSLGTTVTLTANASDDDGSIAKVAFYDVGTLLGTDTTAPYSFSWKGAATGLHLLYAIAYDDDGTPKVSDSRVMTVKAALASAPPPVDDRPPVAETPPVDDTPPPSDGTSSSSGGTLPALKPVRLGFIPSDDDAVVSFYRLEIYEAGDLPGKDPAVATHNLGKPTPVSGESIVDIAPVLVPLLSRSYVAVVTAVGTGGGETKSAPSAPFTR